jgi:sugar O-acyltransferase (sialic acid O-acetyltransferase NeuD family)
MARVVLFGTGSFAEVARFLLDRDSEHEVVAFCVHRDHLPPGGEHAGLPVVAFEDVAERYPPAEHAMHVAVAYARVNRLRAEICAAARALGYELVTYVSSRATHWGDTVIGDNCFVFEDNTIQPFVTIGDGTVLWSGNHIGHHSTIGSYCFVTSHVVVSGHVTVGDYSFVGVNATLRDGITIGRANVIGAGALIMRSTEDEDVFVPERTRPSGRRSSELKM